MWSGGGSLSKPCHPAMARQCTAVLWLTRGRPELLTSRWSCRLYTTSLVHQLSPALANKWCSFPVQQFVLASLFFPKFWLAIINLTSSDWLYNLALGPLGTQRCGLSTLVQWLYFFDSLDSDMLNFLIGWYYFMASDWLVDIISWLLIGHELANSGFARWNFVS